MTEWEIVQRGIHAPRMSSSCYTGDDEGEEDERAENQPKVSTEKGGWAKMGKKCLEAHYKGHCKCWTSLCPVIVS